MENTILILEKNQNKQKADLLERRSNIIELNSEHK
jgi:hypothetical protein